MPTPTYKPLATVTLGTTASSVTFSSIPATYRDLILVIDATTGADALLHLRFNADSGNNYNFARAVGFSGGTFSDTSSNVSEIRNTIQFGTGKGNGITQIMDYSATDKHKTVLQRGNNKGAAEAAMGAGRWANTAAITSIVCGLNTSTFSSGSRFDLYGVIA
jgi:hypothetical protein